MQQTEALFKTRSYTPAQVGRLCGVKTTTVHAWISRKEIMSVKVGSRRFITERNIAEMYSRRKSGEFVDHTYANGPVRS